MKLHNREQGSTSSKTFYILDASQTNHLNFLTIGHRDFINLHFLKCGKIYNSNTVMVAAIVEGFTLFRYFGGQSLYSCSNVTILL